MRGVLYLDGVGFVVLRVPERGISLRARCSDKIRSLCKVKSFNDWEVLTTVELVDGSKCDVVFMFDTVMRLLEIDSSFLNDIDKLGIGEFFTSVKGYDVDVFYGIVGGKKLPKVLCVDRKKVQKRVLYAYDDGILGLVGDTLGGDVEYVDKKLRKKLENLLEKYFIDD